MSRAAGQATSKHATSKHATSKQAHPTEAALKTAALKRFGALETGRLTWLGLSVVLIGWAMLIAVAVLADGPHFPRWPAFHGDLMTIAQTLIGSGFALAAIGALQAGFGSLDRFFGAVLVRSGARAAEEPAEPDAGQGSGTVRMYGSGVYDAGATVEEPRRRPYRTLPDGSVEVETILGTRRFASMRDAREFI